jgi:hypothetical protein
MRFVLPEEDEDPEEEEEELDEEEEPLLLLLLLPLLLLLLSLLLDESDEDDADRFRAFFFFGLASSSAASVSGLFSPGGSSRSKVGGRSEASSLDLLSLSTYAFGFLHSYVQCPICRHFWHCIFLGASSLCLRLTACISSKYTDKMVSNHKISVG